MPKEYIEREAIKSKSYPFPCAIGVEYAVPLRAINEEPTADVVEVVRCKDCKYHEKDEIGVWCNRVFNSHKTVEDNFCKFGAKWIRSE